MCLQYYNPQADGYYETYVGLKQSRPSFTYLDHLFLFFIFDCNPSIQVGEAWTQSPFWLWLLVPATTQDDDKLFVGSPFGIHKGFQSKSRSRWPIWTALICLWLARGDSEADSQFGEYRSNSPWGMIYKSLAHLGIEKQTVIQAFSGIALWWMVVALVGFGLFL